MRNGKGILQPDKAGNFGYELVSLYKITGQEKYLDAAVRIARVLAGKTRESNENESPLPFRGHPDRILIFKILVYFCMIPGI